MASQADLKTLTYDFMGDPMVYVGGNNNSLTLNGIAYDFMGEPFAIANANGAPPVAPKIGFPFALFMKEI